MTVPSYLNNISTKWQLLVGVAAFLVLSLETVEAWVLTTAGIRHSVNFPTVDFPTARARRLCWATLNDLSWRRNQWILRDAKHNEQDRCSSNRHRSDDEDDDENRAEIFMDHNIKSIHSEGDQSDPTTPEYVAREMFLHDTLQSDDEHHHDNRNRKDGIPSPEDHVVVKRLNNKKKAGKPSNKQQQQQQHQESNTSTYRVLDNRDSLPFAVTITTPDPYTHPDMKRQNVVRAPRRSSRRDNVDDTVVASSLYFVPDTSKTSTHSKKKKNDKNNNNNNNSITPSLSTPVVDPSTFLGDFVLDKYTTTGDVLEIHNTVYKVIRHRCQYKYIGGKQFVMVRKILEVKEVGRLLTEEYLHRQWNQSSRTLPALSSSTSSSTDSNCSNKMTPRDEPP